jgi:hypothetical protein
MGQATRTTKLLLDLGKRAEGGVNTGKRAHLTATAEVLTQARAFYLDFFLAHAENLAEQVTYYSEKHLEMRTRALSPNELQTWAEAHTVATREHPTPWEGWSFSERFPRMPFVYRRAAIKDAIGKARAYLSSLARWEKSGKKAGRPGLPGAANHPMLYEGTVELDLSRSGKEHTRFVRLKVYTGTTWIWANYPIKNHRYFQQRLTDPAWEKQSPKLVLRKDVAELHFSQTKEVKAKKIVESKQDPDLVTVSVDLQRARSGTLPPSGAHCQKAMAVGQAGEWRAQQPAVVETCSSDERGRSTSCCPRHRQRVCQVSRLRLGI